MTIVDHHRGRLIPWRTVDLEIGAERFPYRFGLDTVDRLVDDLAATEADRYLVVTDDTVLHLHGSPLLHLLGRHAPVTVLSRVAGEGLKSMRTLTAHAERAITAGASRQSVVVALGGGAVGNLAGLLAAVLYRGVRLVHVPTTLVAATDSVISLKQAVNSGLGKNHLGTYLRPWSVLTDLRFLQTLPPREVRSGLGEALKNCLAIRPASIASFVNTVLDADPLEPAALRWLLTESITAKQHVMRDDAHERGVGLILEYGHTIGHAIELCSQRSDRTGNLSHGEAVGIGMIAAAHISHRLGHLSEAGVDLHESLVGRLGGPTRIPAEVPLDEVLTVVRADNKRGYLPVLPNETPMVLLRSLGEPLGPRELPVVSVPIEIIGDVLLDL